MFHARIDDSPETVCKELEEIDRYASLQLEQDYFKQYEWLNADHFARPPSKELMLRNVFLPFLQSTMGVDISKEAPSTQIPEQDKLYMYFIYICCRSEQKPNTLPHVKFHCRPRKAMCHITYRNSYISAISNRYLF